MRKSIYLLGLCFLGISTHMIVVAQEVFTGDSVTFKKRIYKVSIITTGSKKSTGYLANISDSNLYLSASPLHFGSVKTSDHLSDYSFYHLEKIEIERKGVAIRSAWQGALIGLIAGVITGLVSGDDPSAPVYNNPNDPFGTALYVFASVRLTAGQKAMALGMVGMGSGCTIGVIAGVLAKKKFIIGRDKEKFHSMRKNILEKLYVTQ